ncbi:E3 ubiquitin/ISG15 ligase TRIM25-like [Bufo bufo]|uniref:E3 ubiquitin/ISG15 ligase TRIM25-like n=1 Tax=Bufo bufo TaxID=8384 RepID=UPI001ABE1F01|nr:E3 ubiquitin/ISG15 ligase TRIM25-like [Bufo bufo]
MALAALKEELTCFLCPNMYTDDLTHLKCGHSFCRECLEYVLETQSASANFKGFTCPECREELEMLPMPQKNVSLHKIAKHVLSAKQEKAVVETLCTYCIHSQVPAIRSCLLCEASLCNDHLKVHSKSKEHILIEPMTSTANRKCSIHDNALLYYCTEDTSCVCVSCSLAGEHKGHHIESLNEASERIKESLRDLLRNLTLKRQETKRGLQTLQNVKTDMMEKAVRIKDMITTLFSDIRRQLDLLQSKVFCELSSEEERVSLSISDLIKQLETEKDKMSVEINQIEEMCNMTDPLALLQAGKSSFPGMDKKILNEERNVLHSINGLDEGLIAATFYKGLADIVTGIKRKSYVAADLDILLDVNTAANSLDISADLRLSSCSVNWNNYTKTPQRFQSHQVLSTRSFCTGQHYWEVETARTGAFRLGVVYATIDRQGGPSFIGNNDKSWGLRRCKNKYSFRYDQVKVKIPHKPSSQTLAIFLDYEAGQLSFYELSDPIRHLYTVKTTFTEPVHPAFFICNNCWIRIIT